MSKKPSLESVAARTNPESLVYDRLSGTFVRVPTALDPFSDPGESQSPQSAPFRQQIKLVPELNTDQVYQTAGGLELVNTTGKNVRFVSEHSFASGVHEIEILNLVSFKNTKLKLLRTNSKGKLTEFALGLDKFVGTDSVVARIDVKSKVFSAFSAALNKSTEVPLKGSSFKLAIEFKSIGDFVSLNPLYLHRGQNNVWTFNQRHFDSKFLKLAKNWIVLKEVADGSDAALQSLMKELTGAEPDASTADSILYQADAQLAAFKIPADKVKEARKVAKGKKAVSGTTLKNVLMQVFHGISLENPIQHAKLVDFVTKYRDRLTEHVCASRVGELAEQFRAFKPASVDFTHSASVGLAKAEYLEAHDSLLLFNGVNKLRVLSDRSRKNQLVVSPFLFDDSRVSFYTSREEFDFLFRSLDWKDLSTRLHMTATESQQLEQLFTTLRDPKALLFDGHFYYFALEASLVQCLVERVFEYLNLVISCAYPHQSDRDEIPDEAQPESAPGDKARPEDPGIDHALMDLFNEENVQSSPAEMEPKQARSHLDSFFSNKLESFPTEFDGVLATLFKIEEALFLQSESYRKAAWVVSRSHTGLARLFSFATSPLPLDQVRRLVDFGLYVNSAFLGEFKHYRHESCAYNDFNDQNTAEVYLRSYASLKANPSPDSSPSDNVRLGFSVSHMPVWSCQQKIDRVFVLRGGQFVGVVTESLDLYVLSAQFGLVELFKTHLGSPVNWTAPKQFENLVKNDAADVKDIEVEEMPAETAAPKAGSAAIPLPEKPEEMEKVIDKSMLDQLYNMGFPLELCKKALYDVKSASFEEAINQVLKLKEEKVEFAGPTKKKVLHLQLKPQWNCKVCTLVNVVDYSNPTPDMCDACGNVADQDAYFEEEEEEIVEPATVEPERQFKSEVVLQTADYIVGMDFLSLKKDNLLHKDFVVLAVRRMDKTHLLVSRLALSEPLIRTLAFQDPKTKAFASWPGFNHLKKGLLERELGLNWSQYFEDKILGILGHSWAGHMFVETNRKMFPIEIKDEVAAIFVNRHTGLNPRGSEEALVYASGPKMTQIIAIANKSRNYCANEFDIELVETVEAPNLRILFAVGKESLVGLNDASVDTYSHKLQSSGEKTAVQNQLRVLSAAPNEVAVLQSDNKVAKLPLKAKDFGTAARQFQDSLDSLKNKGVSSEKNDSVPPQTILSYFKTQSSLSFKSSKLSNCYNLTPSISKVFAVKVLPVDPQAPSSLELKHISQEEGCNLNVDLYVKAPKSTPSLQLFSSSADAATQKHHKTFSNSYTKLELRCLAFKGAPFSKSVHISQMLSSDGEYFATKQPFNLFVFESSFERVMKIKKIVLELSPAMKANSAVDEVLVFIFSDLALLNSMRKLTDLSIQKVEHAIKHGSLAPGLESCLKLSLKKAENSRVSEELELALTGKYIAILPLKGDAPVAANPKRLDCFQYFSAEGEYESDLLLENLIASASVPKQSSGGAFLPDFSLRVQQNGREEVLTNFSIVNVQERPNEFVAKIRKSVSLVGKVDRLRVELPPKAHDIQAIALSASLSNISHSLVTKIRDQLETGASEKLVSVFKQYNEAIVGGSEEGNTAFAANYLNLVDLLLFVLENFGVKAVGSVLTIDFRQILGKFILNSQDRKVIGASRFLMEKLFTFEASHDYFVAIFAEALKQLPQKGVTFEGLETMWKLLANFVEAAKDSAKIDTLKAVFAHLTKVLSRTEALNTPNNMLLRSLAIPETLNLMVPFRAEADDKKAEKSPQTGPNAVVPAANSVEAVDNSNLIEYNCQSYHDKHFAEYMINCTDVIKLDQILVRFPKIKPLLTTTLEVHAFNPAAEVFEVVKTKHLGPDFSNYVSSKTMSEDPAVLGHYHLGLNFENFDRPVKLLKVVARINHIPIFEYTDSDSTIYEFFIHGTKVEGLISSAPIPEDSKAQISSLLVKETTDKCNQKYASSDDEISAVSNLKSKCREVNSAAVYLKTKGKTVDKNAPAAPQKSEKEPAEQPASTEIKDTLELLNRIKESVEDQLQTIEMADLKSSSMVTAAISGQVEQYRTALEAKKAKLADSSNLEENLTFWLSDLGMFVKEFGKLTKRPDNFELLSKSGASVEDLLARVFFDGYFFEIKDDKSEFEAFLADLVKLLGPEEPAKMLDKLCAIYKSMGNAVFVKNLDKFVDALRALKLHNVHPWTHLNAQIGALTDRKPEDLSQDQLKELMLNCSLLVASPFDSTPASQAVFAEMERIVVWVLSNKLELASKKFEELVLVLLAQMFKFLAPGQPAEIELNPESLKKVFEFTAQNGMLPKLDKIISDFSKLVSKVPSKSADAKRFRAMMNVAKLTLMGFVTEQVIESDANQLYGAERVSEILFFALSNIKSMEEIQTNLSGEKDEDAAKGAPAPAPTLQPVSSPTLPAPSGPKKTQKVERSGSLIQVLPEGDPVLSLFVNDILRYMSGRRIQDVGLISIITNFAISESMSPQLLIVICKFAMTQTREIRQTIVQDLGAKVAEIHRKLKQNKNKAAVRDFSSLTVELLIELLKNNVQQLAEDAAVAHFAIGLTLHIINESEAKVVTNEQCKLALKPQLLAPLLGVAANFLAERYNFGGPENFANFLDDEVNLFELLSNCLHIVARGVDDSGSSLLMYFVQNFKSIRDAGGDAWDADAALESLSVWAMCNYTNSFPELRSVAGPILKKVHTDVNYLINELFKKEEAAKVLLNCICANFRRLNGVLTKKVEKKALGYQALYMSENSIDFLETVLKTTSENEILASHFLLANKGLELIFEILHHNSGEAVSGSQASAQKDSFLAQMRRASQAGSGKPAADPGKAILSMGKDKALFEEEFGAKIVNVVLDKTITSGSATKDWCANKSGKNANIYNTAIPVNRKSISLRFKAAEDFELRTMRLSLVVARTENYLVVGPAPYVHLYAIQEDEKKEARRVFLGELKRVNDTGYLLFNSVVYVLNMNKLNGKDFAGAIEGLRHARELREFELVIGRPQFSVVDKTSPLTTRTISAVNLSINFLSVEGFTHNKVDVPVVFRARVQASFSKFLEIIFNSDSFSASIDEYFDSVNRERRTGIYELIESQLGPIMANFEEKMAKLLMTLSEKNKRLADSIFLFLLKNIEKKPFFFFLVEKIFKKTFSYRYLFEFFDFGRRKLMSDPAFLSRFLMVLANYLSFLENKLKQEGHPALLALPVDEKFFNAVLSAHKQAPFTFQIERYIALTINLLLEGKLHTVLPPSVSKLDGYVLDPSQLTQNTKEFGALLVNTLVERITSGEHIFLHVLGCIALKAPEAKQAIIEKKMIEAVAQRLQNKEADLTMETVLFIQTASEDADLYSILIGQSVDQRLLELLEESVKKKAFRDNLELVNLVLKTVFAVFKRSAGQIERLEEVLFEMLKRNKGDSFFIERVLLKFFEFEITKKVAFSLRKAPADPLAAKAQAQPDAAGEAAPGEQAQIKIKSGIMGSQLFGRLAAKLPFLVDEKTDKNFKALEWRKIVETSDGNEDFSAKFEPHMYLKRPLLFLMNVDNGGAVGFFGLFVPEGFVKYADPVDGTAYVPNSDNAFLFWYSEDTFVHYKPALENCDKFLKYSDKNGAKSMAFVVDDSEKLVIGMDADTASAIDMYMMKPVPSDNLPDFEFPYDCVINSLEIFQLEMKVDEKVETAHEANQELIAGRYIDKLGHVDVQGSVFGESLYYELPEQLSLKSLKAVVPQLQLAEDK
jgi:hypothetical protein